MNDKDKKKKEIQKQGVIAKLKGIFSNPNVKKLEKMGYKRKGLGFRKDK